jgi:pSer/pThr/pTyr-binding forkhead associated (FHA) protein
VITLTLLHPIQGVPVQSWSFETEPVIRIGRSTNNDVILYSAVVSRNHIEIRKGNSCWEVVNLGANGTYIDGKRIERQEAVDGLVIRLASSGPKIQIRLQSEVVEPVEQAASGKPQTTGRPKRRMDDAKLTLIGDDETT